jgi:hypothetical protein
MIEYRKFVSEFLPNDESIFVVERYLGQFTIVSGREISDGAALLAIAEYLRKTTARPKYKNVTEELIDKHLSFNWHDEPDKPGYNFKLDWPIFLWRSTKQSS